MEIKFPEGWNPAFCANHGPRAVNDYYGMKEFIPAKIDSFMDIGCGMGQLAAALALGTGAKDVYVLDGDSYLGQVRGLRKTTKAWNPVANAASVVKLNCPDVNVHALTQDSPFPLKVDLVVSTRSWGTHYPVEMYLDRVRELGCPFLLDLRKPHYEEGHQIEGYRAEPIRDFRKYRRVIFYPEAE